MYYFNVTLFPASSSYTCSASPTGTLSAAQPQNHNPYSLLVAISNTLCFWSHRCEGTQSCDWGCHHYWNNIGQFTLVQVLQPSKTLSETVTSWKNFPESDRQVSCVYFHGCKPVSIRKRTQECIIKDDNSWFATGTSKKLMLNLFFFSGLWWSFWTTFTLTSAVFPNSWRQNFREVCRMLS